MLNEFSRTELLIGSEALKKLGNSHIAIFGIGGVGGYIAEALARSGVGKLDIFDNDTVSLTNINRQIIATHKTIGMPKVEAMKQRIADINPSAQVNAYQTFYMPENSSEFDFSQYDYIADAVDTVTAKIEIAVQAQKCGTPLISSMGAGNKLNPAMFEVSDIYKTSVCPLAKVMRRELKARGIKKLKVVYSKEQPLKPVGETEEISVKRAVPGSTAFVPSVAGLIMASEIIKDIINNPTTKFYD